MHGNADATDQERDSYVITEDDYVEFLSRMASQTALPATFAEPFRKSHFLFLGYGLRDWNLRVVLHKIWKTWPNRATHRGLCSIKLNGSSGVLEPPAAHDLRATVDSFLAQLKAAVPQ
jgi:hypothetical protein